MISQMINELYITNIIGSREFNNEEKIKSILQLFRVSFEDKQQMINDQANLISSQQKLIEIIVQKKNTNENNTTNNVTIDNDLIKSNDIMDENNNGNFRKIASNYNIYLQYCIYYVYVYFFIGIKPLYKVFIGQLPPSIPIVQIKNHLNEIFGHVDSVYQLIPNVSIIYMIGVIFLM